MKKALKTIWFITYYYGSMVIICMLFMQLIFHTNFITPMFAHLEYEKGTPTVIVNKHFKLVYTQRVTDAGDFSKWIYYYDGVRCGDTYNATHNSIYGMVLYALNDRDRGIKLN